MQISLVTWQFVRLMVYLENHPGLGRSNDLPALGDAWRDLWQPIDAELAELSESDFESYADMMMGQNVVIEAVAPAHVAACAQALQAIAKDLGTALERESRNKAADTAHLENLEFERSELMRKTGELNES